MVEIPEKYVLLIDSFKRVTKFIIIIFDKSDLTVKQVITRNFIAKSHSPLNSIFLLLKENQEGEAISLYRLLIERYFYLMYLHKTDSYQAFKNWSYLKTFESRNKMRSNTQFNSLDTKKILQDDKEQVKKYEDLKKQKNLWIEPNLEKFAKELDLSFLYSLGYDLGSSFIHPRADEGYWDAQRIVKKEKIIEFKRDNILKNSILISNALVFFGVNHCDYNFGKNLNLYCNLVFVFLNDGKIITDWKNIENYFYADNLKE